MVPSALLKMHKQCEAASNAFFAFYPNATINANSIYLSLSQRYHRKVSLSFSQYQSEYTSRLKPG